ncbi:hypothetical protein BDR03DRAFT_981724 [Suillus americanus]|nr:hypothetical protein BDR03DRAFT_981724 [Suillus americanus]
MSSTLQRAYKPGLCTDQTTPVAVTASPPPANDLARSRGPLAMKAGMTAQGGDKFIPIRKIESGMGLFNVIGVVTSIKPLTQTRKKHAEWLPQAEVGGIVLFRRVKPSTFRGGLNGIGYGNKLRWATYDIQARRFRDPDRNDALHFEILDEGFGYSFSPYYEPSEQGKETEYCAQLADWWQAIHAKEQGITTAQCAPRPIIRSDAYADIQSPKLYRITCRVAIRAHRMSGVGLMHNANDTCKCTSSLDERPKQCTESPDITKCIPSKMDRVETGCRLQKWKCLTKDDAVEL